MSMNASCDAASEPAMRRATVDFPEPDPPAIPTISDTRSRWREEVPRLHLSQAAAASAGMGAFGLSQLGIDGVSAELRAASSRPAGGASTRTPTLPGRPLAWLDE